LLNKFLKSVHSSNKNFYFQIKNTPFYVNYLMDTFLKNVDVPNLKLERIIFQLFKLGGKIFVSSKLYQFDFLLIVEPSYLNTN